jgi:RNA ligase (TIGR02306 family)
MERKLATIEKILGIQPIPTADTLEVATIRGWQVVVKKGTFSVGDLCIYCEIDSFLPVRPEFEFLRKSCYRKLPDGDGFHIKTVRLRGQVSQGIAFPLTLEMFPLAHIAYNEVGEIGMDVTELIGIKKFEPPIPTELSGQAKGFLPAFLKRTDEERIQNIPWIFKKYVGCTYYITEKLDGASATFYVRDGVFGVCSRNLELLDSPTNSFWRVVRQFDIDKKMFSLKKNFALQGELVGNGIGKIKYGLKEQTVRFYSMFNIDTYEYEPLQVLETTLRTLNLGMVPIIAVNVTFPTDTTVKQILEMADGDSLYNPSVSREGIVVRSMSADKAPDIETGYLSFKVISNTHLVKEDEL